MQLLDNQGFPGSSDGKDSSCNEGDLGLIPGLGRSSGGRHGNQYSCLENPHGQRSLVGYSQWGRRESDTTERLSTQHTTQPSNCIPEHLSQRRANLGSIPELIRFPGEGNGYPLQYSCLENPRGQRSLVGHSPWDHKELDTTEQLTLSLFH